MASELQIEANRRNAKKSRGPKSGAGKMTSSRNALRHGLARTQTGKNSAPDSLVSLISAYLGEDDETSLHDEASQERSAHA